MSGQPFDLTTWEGRIEYQRGRGLTAEEIADAFDHIYAVSGEVPTRGGEWLEWGLLHGRRRILPMIAAICGEAAPAIDAWWTPRRMETAARYRDAVRWLRRNGGASVAAAARRARVDRGTLAAWIKDGKLEPPAAVSDR